MRSTTMAITPTMIRTWFRGTVRTQPDDAGSVSYVRVVRVGKKLVVTWRAYAYMMTNRSFAAFVKKNRARVLVDP